MSTLITASAPHHTVEVEQCTACGRIVCRSNLLETALGYFICDDFEECIAFYSGWGVPPAIGIKPPEVTP
jgi:hypothetical protein